MYKETHLRSVLKTISWRFWATLTTVSLVLIFVGRLDLALTVGGFEVVLKLIIYFFHERFWDKIKYGKKEIKPSVIWLTGLARSGKSAIAKSVVEKLKEKGFKAEHLDGHTIRHFFPETGYSKYEVNEHIKRVGYLASKLEEQGIFVVASFLSPYKESRDFVKSICKNYMEVYVATPLKFCEEKDTTGIFQKARNGDVQNFPGINSPYEAPADGELNVDISKETIEQAANKIFDNIKEVN